MTRRRALLTLSLAALAILATILWTGTSHGTPPCTGYDCSTPVDRPSP